MFQYVTKNILQFIYIFFYNLILKLIEIMGENSLFFLVKKSK